MVLDEQTIDGLKDRLATSEGVSGAIDAYKARRQDVLDLSAAEGRFWTEDDGARRKELDAYYEAQDRWTERTQEEKIALAMDFAPEIATKGLALEAHSADYHHRREAALTKVGEALTECLRAMGSEAANLFAELVRDETILPFEARQAVYHAASRLKQFEVDGRKLFDRDVPRDLSAGPFTQSFTKGVAKSLGLNAYADARQVMERIGQPGYGYVLTNADGLRDMRRISAKGDEGVTILSVSEPRDGQALMAVRFDEVDVPEGATGPTEFGIGRVRRMTDHLQLLGIGVADRSLRSNTRGGSLVALAKASDLRTVPDGTVIAWHLATTHGEADGNRFGRVGAAEVGLWNTVRNELRVEAERRNLTGEQIVAEMEDMSMTEVPNANVGWVDRDDTEPVLIVDLSLADIDQKAVAETITLAVGHEKNWAWAEHTEISEFEEVVEKSIDALGIRAAIDNYHELHNEDQVVGLLLRSGDVPVGSPADVCSKYVVAQYAYGTDINWDLASEASVWLKKLDNAKPAAAPSP